MSAGRFRVRHDLVLRRWFVCDLWTGRTRGMYETPSEAFCAARRANRALGVTL